MSEFFMEHDQHNRTFSTRYMYLTPLGPKYLLDENGEIAVDVTSEDGIGSQVAEGRAHLKSHAVRRTLLLMDNLYND